MHALHGSLAARMLFTSAFFATEASEAAPPPEAIECKRVYLHEYVYTEIVYVLEVGVSAGAAGPSVAGSSVKSHHA